MNHPPRDRNASVLLTQSDAPGKDQELVEAQALNNTLVQ